MAKKLSQEELKESIARAKTEIRQCENYINQQTKKNSKLERSLRTRRLIQRGAILESMIREPDTLTNEQIKKMLKTAFLSAQETVREMADAFRAENAAAANANSGENELPGTN